MLEKGYTDEMILGFKSVTKQLLKQAKLSQGWACGQILGLK